MASPGSNVHELIFSCVHPMPFKLNYEHGFSPHFLYLRCFHLPFIRLHTTSSWFDQSPTQPLSSISSSLFQNPNVHDVSASEPKAANNVHSTACHPNPLDIIQYSNSTPVTFARNPLSLPHPIANSDQFYVNMDELKLNFVSPTNFLLPSFIARSVPGSRIARFHIFAFL